MRIAFTILFFCFTLMLSAKAPNLIEADSTKLTNEIQEEKIYEYAEIMPEFSGGKEAMMKYLISNIKYPPKWAEGGPEGKIIVRFYIDTDGSIKNTTIKNNEIGDELESEVLRIINSMPKWKPATLQGKLVKCYYMLPVNICIRR